MFVLRTALAAACLTVLAPLAATAGTTTQNDNGVQMIVTIPDVAPAPSKPKKKPVAIAKAATPNVPAPSAQDGPTETNKRYTAALLANAQALAGRRYVFGGTSPAGFDCSGYTQYVFATVGLQIPRTADAQFAAGRTIAGNPLPGDLVFFQTYEYGASHVALYLGGGQFINAIGQNVHVADFNSSYFRGRYLGARRFLPD